MVSLEKMLNEIFTEVFKDLIREKAALRCLATMNKKLSITAIRTLAHSIDICVQTDCNPPDVYIYPATPPLSTFVEARLAAHRQNHSEIPMTPRLPTSAHWLRSSFLAGRGLYIYIYIYVCMCAGGLGGRVS